MHAHDVHIRVCDVRQARRVAHPASRQASERSAAGGVRQNFFIRNVPLRVSFDTVEHRLIPDLSGSADVLLESSEDKAVLIPLGALLEEEGRSYVQVKTEHGFAKREVKTGLRNDTHAVIASGLDAGQEIRANY